MIIGIRPGGAGATGGAALRLAAGPDQRAVYLKLVVSQVKRAARVIRIWRGVRASSAGLVKCG